MRLVKDDPSGGGVLKRLLPTIATLLALAPPVLAQGLDLSDALKALPSTLDWQSADLSYESAVRQLEAALAAQGLKLSGGADYTLREGSGSGLTVSGTASLGVLPWSSSADAVRSAERALERAALARREARNNLYIALHTQYFNLRQAQADLALAQATLALRERQLQIVTAQNQAGSATLSDLLTAQQNLDTARSSLLSAQGALELARLTLAGTLGLNPQQLGNPTTPPEEPSLPDEGLEALLQRALASRPDVLRALSQLRDAEENLASAERNRLIPNASVTVGYSDSGSTLSAGLNLKSGTASLSAALPVGQATSSTLSQGYSLGLSLSVPIFDPVSDSSIRTAQTALQAARQALETARRAAELDVRQKYQNLQTAQAAIAAARAALNTANQNLRTAQARLQAGTGTSVEVQAAQVSQLQAQRNLEAALIQAQLAALALQNALGADLTAALGGK
ncbi:outer membrane efflux protein [Meiothermus ruber DSM 1279]|uniref:Outer membrane efflux protein n=1 Tax=Meiothermus ruber (strain ATCC 35948 / DSM 1279 / VKM B-1258 / 21) TaxID=504728 RepID=A0A806CXN8_MEIRD|nr:outer membrane efflux protein [Meiothermus ruber DSM 1279]MCL6529578.1 TolC family protein [Meiothermus ruber]